MTIRSATQLKRELKDYADAADRARRVLELFDELGHSAERRIEQAGRLLAAHRTAARCVLPASAALMLLAVVLPPVDVPLQAIVIGVSFPGLSTAWYLLAGLIVVLFVTAAIHGSVYAFVHDESRPLRAPRFAATLGGVLLMMFMVAAAVGTLTLRVWDASLAEQFRWLAQVSVLAAAELGAAAGGFLGAAAWPGVRVWWIRTQLFRTRRALRSLIDVGDVLAKEIGDEDERWEASRTQLVSALDEIERTVTAHRPHRVAPAMATLVIAAGVITSACATPPTPDPAQPVDAISMSFSQSVEEPERTCAFLIDGSGSLDEEHEARAVELLKNETEELTQRLQCGTIAAGIFADAGEWTGSVEYVRLPAVRTSIDCSKAQPVVDGFDRLLANNPAFREGLEQRARAKCETQRAPTREDERRNALSRVSNALNQSERGGDTDLAGAIEAVLRPGGVAIVLTDGIQTVRRSARFVVPPDALVVLLIVPTKPKFGGAKAIRAAAESWQSVDHVIVRPYPALGDPEFLQQVARQLNKTN